MARDPRQRPTARSQPPPRPLNEARLRSNRVSLQPRPRDRRRRALRRRRNELVDAQRQRRGRDRRLGRGRVAHRRRRQSRCACSGTATSRGRRADGRPSVSTRIRRVHRARSRWSSTCTTRIRRPRSQASCGASSSPCSTTGRDDPPLVLGFLGGSRTRRHLPVAAARPWLGAVGRGVPRRDRRRRPERSDRCHPIGLVRIARASGPPRIGSSSGAA